MKKKNMIKTYMNIEKIKQEMVNRYSIIDDYDLLYDLLKKKNFTDIKENDICKMIEAVLYLIENEDCFVREIENEIIIRVKKMLSNKSLNSNNMLSILHYNNVLINDDDFLSYKRDIVNNSEKEEDGKIESYIVIPITSNLQKHLFIEFKLLAAMKVPEPVEHTDVYVDCISNINIKITNIYID